MGGIPEQMISVSPCPAPEWDARNPLLDEVVGDFNGDGRSDIATAPLSMTPAAVSGNHVTSSPLTKEPAPVAHRDLCQPLHGHVVLRRGHKKKGAGR